MSNPVKFLEILNKFILKVEKFEIPERNFKSITKLVKNKNFQPKVMIMISRACAALCEWVLNIVEYHDKYIDFFNEKKRNIKRNQLSPRPRTI